MAEPPPPSLIHALPDVHQLKIRLLWNRGVTDHSLIRAHGEPTLDELHDPFLMPQMARAVERLRHAAAGAEQVVIYGDFDADGVTGSAILSRAFQAVGLRTRTYIPRRLEEGYGLNAAAIERLGSDGARLIITVDCGITSVAEIALASRLGIDVIVCDHHKLPGAAGAEGQASGDRLPEALAILHPGLGGYPFPYLCAAGVCFKLAQALHQSGPWPLAPDPCDARALADYAAVGTLADMVPLVGENRVLTKFGIEKLRREPALGLAAVMDLAGIEAASLTSSDISFTLAPHINASGRLADAGLALRLMIAEDAAEAEGLAERLRDLNTERQRLTQEVLQAAREQIAIQDPDQMAHVIAGEGWPPGVVGLVAGKLVEETGRPAFVAELGPDVCRGSARGVPGFDLVEAMKSCSDLLLRFGGHPMAAGFTLRRESFGDFAHVIVQRAGATLSPRDLDPVLRIDSELKMRHITWDIHRLVQEVAPFGTGNPTPAFLLRGLRPADARATPRGHLRLKFRGALGETIDAFGFGLGEYAHALGQGPIDVVAELSSSRFRGHESLELRLRDLRPSSEDPALGAQGGR